jgi:phage shock protein A
MFKDLQRLFQKSMEAFRQELDRREPEDRVAELLSSMRQELVEARASLPLLEQEVQRAGQARDREREEVAKCERRGTLAERIGDAETARVAGEFAARHRERLAVLEKKLVAAEAELAMRRSEAEEMKRRFKEADANRFALLAQLRQQGARQRMDSMLGEEDSAAADWSRLEDAAEVEARLQELKRRMGRE